MQQVAVDGLTFRDSTAGKNGACSVDARVCDIDI